jgi:fimbrial chaperone protein
MNIFNPPLIAALALMLPPMGWTSLAHAGAFSVSPVRIHMTPRERVVAVSIANEGETEVALQADVHVWAQSADGTDRLESTEDMILAPPIIRLAPKARQVVRLALLRPADAQRQLTYRLIVREVPEITQPKDQTIQVPITLALSMPVFITPPGARRQMACEVQRVDAQTLGTNCHNTGNAYAQVREVVFRRGEQALARFEGGAYILPGAHKVVRADANAVIAPGPAQMDIQFDDGTSQTEPVTLP